MAILLKENISITEIALAVGFSNASYYSEVFKRYVGVTPREYKKLGVNK
jgi:AraC-like DNA-binding protein